MGIILTPGWFFNFDVVIDSTIFLVALGFFFLAWQNYRLSKNRGIFILSSGFLLIALGEVANILTKVLFFYDTTLIRNIGNIVITYHVIRSIDIIPYAGMFFYKVLTLLGLYVIYRTTVKRSSSSDAILIGAFIIISAIFGSMFYFVFHIIAIILLANIIKNYCEIYKKNGSENTQILIIAFAILLASNILCIFSMAGLFYVLGSFLQLISYVILFLLMVRILNSKTKDGQKKPNRNH